MQSKRCQYCGVKLVEVYSEKRAVMSPDNSGWYTIHPQTTRVGDGAPLGPERCGASKLGWGLR